MDLDSFFRQSGAPTMVELSIVVGCNPDQMRQWRHRYKSRKPGTAHAVAIERATGGQVTRADLRPTDYWLHWPDLSVPPASAHQSVAEAL